MRDTVKRWIVKLSGTVIGALVGVLAALNLPLPEDWESQGVLWLAGLLMALFTKLADWVVGKLPIDVSLPSAGSSTGTSIEGEGNLEELVDLERRDR